MTIDVTAEGSVEGERLTEQEIFVRVSYALAGFGFLPKRNSVPWTPHFKPSEYCSDVLYSRHGVEILPFDKERGGRGKFGFNISIPAPLDGPIEGFTSFYMDDNKMWMAALYIEESDTIDVVMKKITSVLLNANNAIENQLGTNVMAYARHFNERISVIEIRVHRIRRMVNPIAIGIICGYMLGGRVGAQGCQAENETLMDYGVPSVYSEQEIAQLDRVVQSKIEGRAVGSHAEIEYELDAAFGGMVQGGLLGVALAWLGTLRERRRRKAKRRE